MKIKTIEGTMKGRTVKAEDLPELGIVQAPNQTGKTTLALLGELAIMRYCRGVSPSPDPRNNNKLRTLGDPLIAKVTTDAGEASYELTSAGAQHENTTGLSKVLWLDPDSFFDLSARDRVAYVVAMSETMTAKEAGERLSEAWETVPDPRDGDEFQAYLDRLTKEQKQIAKEERMAIRTLKNQLAGLPPASNTSDLELSLNTDQARAKELACERQELQGAREAYEKAFAAHQVAEAAYEHEAKQEDEDPPNLIEQDRLIMILEGKIAQVKLDLESAREITRATEGEHLLAYTEYQAALKWQPEKCPHCDQFLQEQPNVEALLDFSTKKETAKRNAQTRENRIRETLKADEAELKKQQAERNCMAKALEAIQHRAGRIKELSLAADRAEAAIPDEPEEPATQNRIDTIEIAIEELEKQAHAAAIAIEKQKQRAQLERDIEGAQEVLDLAKHRAEITQELLSETIARGMEGALAAGNEIARDVLKSEFRMTPKGELVLKPSLDQESHVTIPEQAWSGAETLVAQVVMSVAVAAQQDPAVAWRVVILDDRILTLDSDKQGAMLEALARSQDRGVIDQVMILTPNDLTAPDHSMNGWIRIEATFEARD